MLPSFKDGDKALVNRWFYLLKKPQKNEIIIINKKNIIMIKRIKKTQDNKFFVAGDNLKESTDSRHFGWIEKKDVLGKVVFKF